MASYIVRYALPLGLHCKFGLGLQYQQCSQNISVVLQQVRLNSNRTCISRINRHTYGRLYDSTLVLEDGSTIGIRYKEPRKIIQVPILTSQLTAEQRIARQRRHKPKLEVKLNDDVEAAFDSSQYSQFWKKE